KFNGYEHPISYPVTFHDHKIWLRGLLKQGLYVFDIVSKKFTKYLPDLAISNISFGQQNKYLINPDKIFVLDSANKFIDTIQYVDSGRATHFYNVVEDRYKHLWIITINNGLMMYEYPTKKFSFYKHENSRINSLPIDAVRAIYNDINNNLWVGTDGGGVSKLDIKPKRFNLFPLNEGEYPLLSDYFTKCIYDDNRGNVYFGSLTNGLCIFNKATRQLQQFKNIPGDNSSIQSNTVSAIFSDADHNMWVASSMGISIFKNGRFLRVQLKGNPWVQAWNNLVNRFYQLTNGDMVAAARNGLMYFRKIPGGFEGKYIKKNEYEISDIIEDGDQHVWIGTTGNGLRRINMGVDTFTVNEKYFQGTNIRSIHVDERDPDILWISTVKGLIRFDCRSKKYRVYNQSDGMANSYVYGALEDDKHDLWLSTNSGISYFNRGNESFKNYSVKDGLQSNEFNSGAFFKSQSGTLYFGGIKGFNWFYPSQPGPDKSSPLLGITAASVDDESILRDSVFTSRKTITLPYSKKSVLLSFAVLDYTLPRANSIEYKLEGLEKKWFRTENKDIRYSNLAPGSYTLRVRGISSSENKSPETNIKIVVLPPFWKTSSFIIILLISLLMITVLITINISQRKLKQKLVVYEQQKEMERERQRISREMHDDIGAGLTQITLMSESIKKNGFKGKKELTDIAETSRKLVASMSEIIWSMNQENSTIDEFFAYMRESLYKLLEYSGIDYKISLPDNGRDMVLNTEQKRNILLVVKEIVHNAVKYSNAPEIMIKADLTDKGLKFLISDNGIGFDSSNPKRGNGIYNIQKRVNDLQGTILIRSEHNAGSLFTFFIPLKSHS
ncbi:MAG: ligand-binding sensor domain-containing protein, partial [Mucilaginibacter sp.]